MIDRQTEIEIRIIVHCPYAKILFYDIRMYLYLINGTP